MFRKYHNRTLHTNPRHREEEPQNINSNKTINTKQQLSIPRQDDCKTIKDTKKCTPKTKATTESPQTM